MKSAAIRSSWMTKQGYRLDCQPYLGGALETKIILENLPFPTEKLLELTSGFDGGIYNGPKFSRTWVTSSDYGVPFVGSSAMLDADLRNLPLLSKGLACGRQLRHLELKAGMSLISCSGTIGNMVYARRDMEGMWSSQHIMKVVADPDKVLSGYLFAYLSSKFGVALVISETYGSIIPSIGPQHIVGLPVPRLGQKLEQEIHMLVEDAAELRVKASEEFSGALAELEARASLPSSNEMRRSTDGPVITVESSRLQHRLDTNFHSSYHHNALQPYLTHKVSGRTVASLANEIVEPTRFKRIEHANSEFGIPFFGTGSLGNIDPKPLYKIAPFPDIDKYRVDQRSVLIPRSGQIYGLIGRAVLPIGLVLSSAVTEDAIRVTCETPEEAGFLFLALQSECGLRQLKSRCFGGSIPHLDVNNIGQVLVPELDPSQRHYLGQLATRVSTLRTRAISNEARARELIETTIEASVRN